MKIINLMEDTEGIQDLYAEHGLSIYVETDSHRILVDTGASARTWENAACLGIDVRRVDTVFLTHGHYDHAGGILSLADMNPDAVIYMHRAAAHAYYNLRDGREKYIGIDPKILKLSRCIRLWSDLRIDRELSVFGGVTGRRKWPGSNLTLKRRDGDTFVQDSFDHEQYVVIEAEDKKVLLSGCAHNGILNILDRYRELYGGMPDMVISGFHMMKREAFDAEEILLIRDIAAELKETGILFHTGHCTGMPAFTVMKEIMGERLRYMHCGERIFF